MAVAPGARDGGVTKEDTFFSKAKETNTAIKVITIFYVISLSLSHFKEKYDDKRKLTGTHINLRLDQSILEGLKCFHAWEELNLITSITLRINVFILAPNKFLRTIHKLIPCLHQHEDLQQQLLRK